MVDCRAHDLVAPFARTAAPLPMLCARRGTRRERAELPEPANAATEQASSPRENAREQEIDLLRHKINEITTQLSRPKKKKSRRVTSFRNSKRPLEWPAQSPEASEADRHPPAMRKRALSASGENRPSKAELRKACKFVVELSESRDRGPYAEHWISIPLSSPRSRSA